MKKFVPYQKLSKRQKRETDRARRANWGEMSPVTRRPESSNAYDRNRDRRQWKEDGAGPFAVVYCPGVKVCAGDISCRRTARMTNS